LDAQKLIVLGHAFGTGNGANLDLGGPRPHGKVGDRGIFSFTGSGAHDCAKSVALCQLDEFESFG
jgi:hypothetical protein